MKKDKSKPGPEPLLTDELLGKIKKSILDGNDLRETAKVCKIIESTLYTWTRDNYLNISDKIEGWKRDRKVMLAAKNVEEMLQLDVIEDKIGAFGPILDPKTKKRIKEINTGILKVKADISKFVLEALEPNYTKKTTIGVDEELKNAISKIGKILPD